MSFTHIFLESSIIVQLVMLLLLTMSVFSWGVIVWKARLLTIEKKRLHIATNLIQSVSSHEAIKQMDDGSIGSHLGKFMSKANSHYLGCQNRTEIGDAQMRAETTLDSMLYIYNQNIRKGCSTLGIIAGSAPYIGLFGTVIGILVSFQGLADAKVVTLQTVAPGIIEALVATAIGLVTAIPALVGSNMLTKNCNGVVGELMHTKTRILASLHSTHSKKVGGNQ